MTEDGRPKLSIGSRVRVRRDPTFPGPWPAEPLGTIIPWPGYLAEIDPSIGGGETFRVIDHRSGPERYHGLQRVYFVAFDEPQLDTDGDGLFEQAAVWERCLEPLSSE
jgi:hypothetical protein